MKYLFPFLAFALSLLSCKKEASLSTEYKFKLTETLAKEKELVEAKLETVESELMLTGKISFNEDKVARVFPLAG